MSKQHVHLIGIGGTGMTALAGLLQASGYRVTGSDGKLYPPTSVILQNLGLEIFYEFLCHTGKCSFFYKQLDEMPDYVSEHGYAMPVTPILLEGHQKSLSGPSRLSRPEFASLLRS